jgi:hypothetical protein
MVINKTIYLWGISAADFLADNSYLNHELQHIYQYHELGIVRFLFFYLRESLIKGYYNNKFEIEARAAEDLPRKAEFILIK